MADTTTANFNLVKPEVGASVDTWGTKLNADLDSIDSELQSITTDLLADSKAAFNIKQVTNSTRARYNNITGFQSVLTGSYNKQSATSDLLVRIGTVLFSQSPPSGSAAGGMRLTFTAGGAQSIEGVCANSSNSAFIPACTAEKLFSALPAGSFNWTFEVGRFDAFAWYSTVNPNQTDNSALPTNTTTYVTFQESEP